MLAEARVSAAIDYPYSLIRRKGDRRMECGRIEAMCVCLRLKEHQGIHGCNCGGSWSYDDQDNFILGSFPIAKGIVGADYYETKQDT